MLTILMKNKSFLSIVHFWGLICGLLVSGCIHAQSPEEPRVTGPAANGGSGNSYYFYTTSQLQKNNGNLTQALADLQTAIRLDPESLFLKKELALIYLQQGNTDEALPIVQEILKKNPDHADALIMMGSIEQNRQNNRAAQEAYEKVLAVDPKQKSIYLVLGTMYMEENRLDQARTVFEKLVTAFPDAYFGYFFLGKIHKDQGRIPEAEKNFLRTLELEPKLLEPRFELIEMYEKEVFSHIKAADFDIIDIQPGDTIRQIAQKRYRHFTPLIESAVMTVNPTLVSLDAMPVGFRLRLPKARLIEEKADQVEKISKISNMYQGILEAAPENDRAAIEFGLFYTKIGLTEEAEDFFKQIAEKSLTDQSIADNIVFLFFDQKKYSDAIVVLTGMLQAAPQSSDLNYLTGAAYNHMEKYHEAIGYFQKVKADSRFYENAVIYIAYIYQAQKKNQEAIDHLRQAIQQSPMRTEFYLYLGAFYEESEQYDQSESILKAGLDVNPNNTRLLFRLGVVYHKCNKKDDSIAQMEKVVQLDPEDAHALNYLGYTYLELNRKLDQAENLIRKALELLPDDGYITDSLGWLYFKRGEYEKAVEILRKAADLVPDDPIILEHLGDAYLKTENPEKALKSYQQALSSSKKKDAAKLETKIQALSR
ncbi:MAG: tetratricopeptide repeat protein [Thermodesulfobacteriota bacterium]